MLIFLNDDDKTTNNQQDTLKRDEYTVKKAIVTKEKNT